MIDYTLTFSAWKAAQAWIVTDEDKAPAHGWKHPRPSKQGHRTVDQNKHLIVTSKTPATWLTFDEADEVSADSDGKFGVAHVYSSKSPLKGNALFLDLDRKFEENEDPEIQEFYESLITDVSSIIPDIAMFTSMSGNGKHWVVQLDTEDMPRWKKAFREATKQIFYLEKETQEQCHLEFWDPNGGGRYQVIGQENDTFSDDNVLPLLSYDDFFGLPSIMESMKRRAEEEQKASYPADAIFELSVAGATKRLMVSLTEDIVIASSKEILIYDASGLIHRIDSNMGRAIVSTRYMETQEPFIVRLENDYGKKNASTLRNFVIKNDAPSDHKRIIDMARLLITAATVDDIGLLGYKTLDTAALDLQDVNSPTVVFLNGVWSGKEGRFLERDEVKLHNISSATPVINHTYRPLENTSNVFVEQLVKEWGEDFFELLASLLVDSHRRWLAVIGQSRRGKSIIFDMLTTLNVATSGNRGTYIKEKNGRQSSFQYAEQQICTKNFVVIDEITEGTLTWDGDMPVINKEDIVEAHGDRIKRHTGQTQFNVEIKKEHPVQMNKIGTFALISNGEMAFAANDDAHKDRVVAVYAPTNHNQILAQANRSDFRNPDVKDALITEIVKHLPKAAFPPSSRIQQDTALFVSRCQTLFNVKRDSTDKIQPPPPSSPPIEKDIEDTVVIIQDSLIDDQNTGDN